MAFSQFKTALKKVCKKTTCVYHRGDDSYWISTSSVMVDCSRFSEAERTILHHEVSQVALDMRENTDLSSLRKRWVNDTMKPVERTDLRWKSYVLLTSVYGTCGVDASYLELVERLLDVEHFTIEWGGGRLPLQVMYGELLVGFIGPVVFKPDADLWQPLREVLEGAPAPEEVSA